MAKRYIVVAVESSVPISEIGHSKILRRAGKTGRAVNAPGGRERRWTRGSCDVTAPQDMSRPLRDYYT